jgi:hypothetical protein
MLRLDPQRVAALQQDTQRVSALLAGIFIEDDPPRDTTLMPAAQVDSNLAEAEGASPPAGILGLDAAHAALARQMLKQHEWSRQDLLDIAADLDLMLDGALEHINEAAFDAHDVPFAEGEDPVSVNPEIREKVQA